MEVSEVVPRDMEGRGFSPAAGVRFTRRRQGRQGCEETQTVTVRLPLRALRTLRLCVKQPAVHDIKHGLLVQPSTSRI